MKKMISILSLLILFSAVYAEINLGVSEILPGTIYYGTTANVFPNVKVHNYGDETVNVFDLNVRINNGGEDVYDFTKSVTNIVLNAYQETFITMEDLWTVDDPNANYTITATVIIDNDTNPNNNELSENCDIIQLEYTEEAYAIKYVLYGDKTFGSLDLETGDYSQIAEVALSFSNRARGADFADGVMYGIYSYFTNPTVREFHLMQPNGENILLGNITSDDFLYNETISSLTYDYDNHIFYFQTTTGGVFEPKLYTLNPYTLEAEFIGQINNLQFMSIEYADGILYGIEVQQRKLWQIDMETGAGTEIGSFGISSLILDQCLSYDRSSGIMYATFFQDFYGGSLNSVNLETGNTTQIQAYGDNDNMKFFAINSSAPISDENDIIAFSIPEQIGETVIDDVEHTVQLEVPIGTNVTALVPTIEVSANATIFPESGEAQDFTNPVEYTVTAENDDEQNWTVTVSILPANVEVNPEAFALEMNSNEIYTEQFTISNIGSGTIDYIIDVNYLSGNDWMTIDPEFGNLEENETDIIEVTFDTTNLTEGLYQSEIVISYNGSEVIIPVSLTVSATSADENTVSLVTKLIGNYPNPFNPTTTISFQINNQQNEQVELVIYNLKGQKIKRYEIRNWKSGINEIVWSGNDDSGKSVASGIYYYKLKVGAYSQIMKMILMK